MRVDAAAVLAALGDPTRRAVLELLRTSPQSVGELAAQLPVSRPAVSQHLKVLADAGLVTATAIGTRRVYAVRADGLAALRDWLDRMWQDGLAAFAAVLDDDRHDDDRHDDERNRR